MKLGEWLAATELPQAARPVEAIEYQAALDALVRIPEQQLLELDRIEVARLSAVEAGPGAMLPAEGWDWTPATLLGLDMLRREIHLLKSRIEFDKTAANLVGHFRSEIEADLRQSDERMRRLLEQLESEKGNPPPRLRWEHRLEQVRNELLAAQAGLNNSRRQRITTELGLRQGRLHALEQQLAVVDGNARFPTSELEAVLNSLEIEQAELEASRGAIEQQAMQTQAAAAAAWGAVRQFLDQVGGGGQLVMADATRLASLRRQASERAIEADGLLRRLAVILQLLELASHEQTLWRSRHAAQGVSDLARLRSAYRDLEQLRGYLRLSRPHFLQQLALATSLADSERERLPPLTSDGSAPAVGSALTRIYDENEQWARRALAGLDRLDRLALRWSEELEQQRSRLPLVEHARLLFGGVPGWAAAVWDFELFAVEDRLVVDGQTIAGRRRVTVGKILTALTILLVGWWFTELCARVAAAFAVRRLRVEPNQAVLVRRWARVFLLIGLLLCSLVLVKIPLTVFAFMGGALAIGVGFGTQNLLKNFISGILLLFERPFRVGDVLDIAGQRGTIASIGIRASVFELWDGAEVLIPNSALLENNVTNLTYSTKLVRFSVKVGVAYGSDTRQVSRLLTDIADEHGLVQKAPKPQVLLQDFADSSLLFEVRFWMDVMSSNPAQVASDLRHMIAASFSDQGIDIAFPQMDVHLDAEPPIPVRAMGGIAGHEAANEYRA